MAHDAFTASMLSYSLQEFKEEGDVMRFPERT